MRRLHRRIGFSYDVSNSYGRDLPLQVEDLVGANNNPKALPIAEKSACGSRADYRGAVAFGRRRHPICYWLKEMGAHRKAMLLVKSSAMSGGRYKTGEEIPVSGIYHVTHSAHRLPHEVMLLRGEKFPKCQACSDAVAFRLLRAAKEITGGEKRLTFNVALYEIPVLDDDDMAVQTAI